MNSSFNQLFLMNLRLVYRNRTGLFFTLIMPTIIFVALSVLPIGGKFGGPSGGDFNYSQFVLPGIIAMTVMQGGIYGLAYWMIDLKARGVIKRFLVTPLKQSELIISVLASRILVAICQAIFLTLIGVIFFHVTVAVNALLALLFVVLGAGIFLVIGLLISMFADTYEAAAPITTAVGLPLTFLGNIFFPVEGLPKVLRYVGEILPITYLADGIRSLFLGANIPPVVWKDLGILAAWFVAILALALWKFRLKE
ncbi:MAG TPA: ABC transporter permease [Patescibacteria group bacterium]|jgi:ABC-2 type transport system permease protein|nr:ABC transporter permease [Patescibacteria group bacterium]